MKKQVFRAFALAMTLALLVTTMLGSVTVAAAPIPDTTSPSALTVTTKPTYPAITRQVWDNHTDSWATTTSTHFGGDIVHRVTSIVPNMAGHGSYIFTFHERLAPAMTMDFDSIVVRVGGVQVSRGFHYTLNILPAGNGIPFNIAFSPAIFVGFTPGDIIEITYSGTITGAAAVGAPGNISETVLEFSDNSLDVSSTARTAPATTNVFTFRFEVYKYTGVLGDDDRPLADAEFQLRTDPSDPATTISFARPDGGSNTRPAVYSHVLPIASNARTTLLTPESGRLLISGLDVGVYYLIETKAPDGFNILEHPVQIEITHPNGDGESVVTADGNAILHRRVNVLNNAGTNLPGTGGIGRTIFNITGLTMMFGAVALLLWQRKRTVAQ